MRWWWRRHDVLSGSTQDGRSEHAPGRSMPGRVGASHTPPACRRQAHRIRQLPFSTLTRATPRHGPTGQRARRRRVPPAQEGIDDSAWDPPPSFPFFLLFPGRPPPPLSLLFSRNRRSRRRSRALESCRVASRRPVPSWSGLDPGWFLGR